nr:MAG TPA: hypothetical protein [Caudoviricetes sp.]
MQKLRLRRICVNAGVVLIIELILVAMPQIK